MVSGSEPGAAGFCCPFSLALHTGADASLDGQRVNSIHVLFSYPMHNSYIKLVKNCLMSDIYLLLTGYTRIFPGLLVQEESYDRFRTTAFGTHCAVGGVSG